VARNEEGEFELMLGNKQLLSVFFLMVLLLCLCFVGGYLLGRSAAPVVTAVNEPPPQVTPAPVVPATKTETVSKPESIAKAEPAPTPAPLPAPPPTRTAPQAAEKAPEPTKQVAKAETKAKASPEKSTAKSEPAATKQVAAKQGPATGQPIAGRTYLQLSATDKDKAEVMVDLLRRKNFAGIAAPVAERPGLFRVLVGPLADTALTETKAQLKANGFPSDEAIRRVF